MIHEVYPSFRMDVAGGNVTLAGPVRIAGYTGKAIGASGTLKFYIDSVVVGEEIWEEEVVVGDGFKPVNFIGDLGTNQDKQNIIIVPGGSTSVFYIRAHYKSKT